MEHRRTGRLRGIFPIRLRTRSAAGHAVEMRTLADNIGAEGLYLQLPLSLARGASLFALVQVEPTLLMAVRISVLRVEKRSHGLFGLGMRIRQARLLAP